MTRHYANLDDDADSYRGYSAFLQRLHRECGAFRWRLVKHGPRHLIRAKVDGIDVCPVLALGYVLSSGKHETRSIPDSRNMAAAAKIHDSVAACVVHVADGFELSRYWTPLRRARLLAACGLTEKAGGVVDTAEAA